MQKNFKSIERLERILDNNITLPGGYKIGVDGLIGLIPGVGDVLTGGISMFLVYKAVQFNVPKFTVVRIIFNIIIDTTLGSIPLVGDIFDFAWKSNTKNARLIRKHVEKQNIQTKSHQPEIDIQ